MRRPDVRYMRQRDCTRSACSAGCCHGETGADEMRHRQAGVYVGLVVIASFIVFLVYR